MLHIYNLSARKIIVDNEEKEKEIKRQSCERGHALTSAVRLPTMVFIYSDNTKCMTVDQDRHISIQLHILAAQKERKIKQKLIRIH